MVCVVCWNVEFREAMKLISTILVLVCCATILPAADVSSSAKQIDRIVQSYLQKTGISLSEISSDEVFVRRVYVDITGTLPTADEARVFIESEGQNKRAQLIDRLLQSDEFAMYQALKWCDLLRVKAEFPSNLWPNAVQAYHRWVLDAFRNNMPYDQFARALLTTGGSNFRDAPVNFYRPFQKRTPRNIAATVALIFMGVRLEHSGWSEEELLGLDAFFGKIGYKKTAEWKEEIVYFDPMMKFTNSVTKEVVVPTPPGGKPLKLGELDDPRMAFADWLTAPNNLWFAKIIVNRIWNDLIGEGIIDPVDDICTDNPPRSPELLRYLESEMVKNRYDIKHMYRMILNSDTYQRSAVAMQDNDKDLSGFSHYLVRRMDAEVLIDAIDQVTGTHEKYSSAIPEPFTFIPEKQRSVALADGSIKSPFLEMFGRPGRDTSYVSERNNGVSVFQSLHMLNASHIQDKIMRGPAIRKILRSRKSPPQKIDELYLHILSRLPSEEERAAIVKYRKTTGMKPYAVAYDLVWSLVNSKEFILRH